MANPFLRRLLKDNNSKLSDTEKRLGNYFLKLNDGIINKTITNLSEETEVSQTTIFNFVKKLGFKGFQDFKISVARNIQNIPSNTALTAYSDITEEDTSIDIAHKIISFNTNSLINLNDSIKKETLDHIIELMQSSDTLHFFGQGGSTILAYDSYHKFIRTKFKCNYVSDYHMQLSNTIKFTSKDCLFLFSHSGETLETISVAKAARRTDVKIIALTGNGGSELTRYADESIIIYSDESKFRTETLTSRILYLTAMDILYTTIMYTNSEESEEIMDNVRSVIDVTKTSPDYNL